MQDWPILSVITFLPLAGVVFILLLARGDKEYTDRNAKFMALWTSIVTFLFSLILWFRFDVSKASFQFVEKTDWMSLPEIARILALKTPSPKTATKSTSPAISQGSTRTPIIAKRWSAGWIKPSALPKLDSRSPLLSPALCKRARVSLSPTHRQSLTPSS